MGAQSWSTEDKAKLSQLWDTGLSGTKISDQFGGRFSRRAVLGMARRMNLSARDTSMNRTWEGSRTFPKPKLIIQAKILPPAIQTAPEPIGLPGEFPDRGCQWIAGDFTPDFIMCGAPIHKGRFCTFHSHLGHDKKPMPMRGTSRSDRAFS